MVSVDRRFADIMGFIVSAKSQLEAFALRTPNNTQSLYSAREQLWQAARAVSEIIGEMNVTRQMGLSTESSQTKPPTTSSRTPTA
jgi:hypothetical protein